MTHRIEVEDPDGIRESVENYGKIVYEDELNGVRIFDLIVEGATSGQWTRFAIDNKVYIYRLGTLQFKGIIKRRSFTSSGMLRLQGIGFVEQKLRDANAPAYTWSATDTSGVIADDATDILTNVPAVSKGTVADQTVNSFRAHVGQSCLAAITRLCRLTGQDFSFDDANDELDVSDHRGSASSIGTWSEDVEIIKITKEEDEFENVKKVTVIGKNEGTQQVTGSYSSGWSQGDQEVTIIDKSVDTTDEADDLAQQHYNAMHGTSYVFNFQVIDLALSFNLGDVVTIDSPGTNTSSTNLRIVKLKRVVTRSEERVYLQLRATTAREAASDRLKQFFDQRRELDEALALKQGTDNAASVTGVTGAVAVGPSITSVTGGVSSKGASENGYYFGTYTHTMTGDNTWRSVGTSINTGNNIFLFHGVWGFMMIYFYYSGGDVATGDIVRVRAKNTTDSTYYPDSDGLKIISLIKLQDGILQMVTIPFYIHIPLNWTNKNYILQYKIANTWWAAQNANMNYAYHGSEGHVHGDDFDTNDASHPHSDTFDTSDSDHKH